MVISWTLISIINYFDHLQIRVLKLILREMLFKLFHQCSLFLQKVNIWGTKYENPKVIKLNFVDCNILNYIMLYSFIHRLAKFLWWWVHFLKKGSLVVGGGGRVGGQSSNRWGNSGMLVMYILFFLQKWWQIF